MIGRLQGNLIEKHPPHLLLDVHGVGYEVQVSMYTFCRLPELDQVLTLYIHQVVREDANLLFGFFDKSERQLFRLLIKVNGVGPKMALAILSASEPDHFLSCVKNQDAKSLTRLPGVGKKTAERLLIEMQDALKNWQPSLKFSDSSVVSAQLENLVTADAIDALVALGYKVNIAKHTVMKLVKEGMNSADLIRLALQTMPVK